MLEELYTFSLSVMGAAAVDEQPLTFMRTKVAAPAVHNSDDNDSDVSGDD